MISILIRQLTSTDIDDYHRIRLAALEANPEAFVTTLSEGKDKSKSTYESQLSNSLENIILGAFDNSKIIGLLGIFNKQRFKLRHQVELWGTFVTDSYRGRGIAKLLMEEAIRVARGIDGVEQIKLGVVTANIEAKKLYEAYGFKVFGTEIKALKLSDGYHDLEHMVLRL